MDFTFVFDGYLASSPEPALFIFDGYLFEANVPPDILPIVELPSSGGGTGGGNLLSYYKEDKKRRRRIRIDDDEILEIIKIFLRCQEV